MCVYLKNGYKNQGARVIKSKNQKVHHTCVCVCILWEGNKWPIAPNATHRGEFHPKLAC